MITQEYLDKIQRLRLLDDDFRERDYQKIHYDVLKKT